MDNPKLNRLLTILAILAGAGYAVYETTTDPSDREPKTPDEPGWAEYVQSPAERIRYPSDDADKRRAIDEMVAAGPASIDEAISLLPWDASRDAFIEVLVRIGPDAVPLLERALEDPDPGIAAGALVALGRIRDATGDAALRDRIHAKIRAEFPLQIPFERGESDYARQQRAAEARSRYSGMDEYFTYEEGKIHVIEEGVAEVADVSALVALLDEPNGHAREMFRRAIVKLHPRLGPELVEALERVLMNDDVHLENVIACLREIGATRTAVEALTRLVDGADGVRLDVAKALEAMGPDASEAVPALRRAAERLRDQRVGADSDVWIDAEIAVIEKAIAAIEAP